MQLLNKTVRTYLLYFVGIILASIPLLYILLNNVIVNETAEIANLKFKPELMNLPYLERLKASIMSENVVIRIVLKTQFCVVVALLAGIFFINRNLSRKIWKPFYHTLDQLKQYELNQVTQLNLPKTGITEFDHLNGAIVHLTQKSNRAFVLQKEFTDNAAHEMQTPLAIMQNQLEELIQQEGLKETQAEVLESMMEVCDRLARLNMSLLLLARIENEQFIETQLLELVSLTHTLVKQFSEQINDKEIICTISGKPQFMLNANKALTEILLSNLLSNAIKYNVSKGKLSVVFSESGVTFYNTGVPYAMDTEKIFERFSKTAGNAQSIGLGLAIVKRICGVCAYDVSYHFTRATLEHAFTLRFTGPLP